MSQDMRFVTYQGNLQGENAVSICHDAINNFASDDLEIIEFDTEAEAEAEFLAAVKAGWTPRGQYSHKILTAKFQSPGQDGSSHCENGIDIFNLWHPQTKK